MTVYLVISMPKIPYIHRIYMVLANPMKKHIHRSKRKEGQLYKKAHLLLR
jgi:hypothetical protein